MEARDALLVVLIAIIATIALLSPVAINELADLKASEKIKELRHELEGCPGYNPPDDLEDYN